MHGMMIARLSRKGETDGQRSERKEFFRSRVIRIRRGGIGDRDLKRSALSLTRCCWCCSAQF